MPIALRNFVRLAELKGGGGASWVVANLEEEMRGVCSVDIAGRVLVVRSDESEVPVLGH